MRLKMDIGMGRAGGADAAPRLDPRRGAFPGLIRPGTGARASLWRAGPLGRVHGTDAIAALGIGGAQA